MEIVLILLSLYYILSVIFPHFVFSYNPNEIYAQVAMAIICIYCFFYIITKYKQIRLNQFFVPFLFFYLLAFVYVAYPFDSAYSNLLYFFKSFIGISYCIFLYYQLVNNEVKTMRIIYYLYFIQLAYVFYLLGLDRIQYSVLQSAGDVFNSNSGFMLLCCIPMTLLLPWKKTRLIMYLVLVLACVFSGQRSAALAALFTIPFTLSYIKGIMKTSHIILLSVLFLIIMLPYITDSINNILERNQIDKDLGQIGSGRSEIWNVVWSEFWKGNLTQIIFGYGSQEVTKITSSKLGIVVFSHNGWLDTLYTYGVFGLVLYVKMLWQIFRNNKITNYACPTMKNLLLVIFIAFMIKCSTSHGNWDISTLPLTTALSIIIYNTNKFKAQLKFQRNDTFNKRPKNVP